MKFRLCLRAAFISLLLIAGISACNTVKMPSIPGFSLADEPQIGKFVWHDLITENPSAVRKFYAGLFGWEFQDTRLPNGKPYTLARLGDFYIGGIVEVEDPGDGADYSRWLGYLSVEDVDKAVEVTSDAGGTVAVETRNLENIGKVAAIQDPQGAVLGLIRSVNGDPDDTIPDAAGRIVWNELLASDDEQAAEFYKALAGYNIVPLSRRGGTYLILNVGEKQRAGIVQNPFEELPPSWLTYFAVADPDAATAKVQALGGEVLLAPSPEIREGTQALIADPSGAILVLQKWPL